jgi:hypothetical protein
MSDTSKKDYVEHGPATASSVMPELARDVPAPTQPLDVSIDPVAPWTSIHVVKANDQLTALTPMLDAAVAAQNYQAIETLTRSVVYLSIYINGCYGR